MLDSTKFYFYSNREGIYKKLDNFELAKRDSIKSAQLREKR
jgi:hypothetical protein